jgi:hypothetical protein
MVVEGHQPRVCSTTAMWPSSLPLSPLPSTPYHPQTPPLDFVLFVATPRLIIVVLHLVPLLIAGVPL